MADWTPRFWYGPARRAFRPSRELTSFPAGRWGTMVGEETLRDRIAADEALYEAFRPMPEIPGAVSYDENEHGGMRDFRGHTPNDYDEEPVGFVDEALYLLPDDPTDD